MQSTALDKHTFPFICYSQEPTRQLLKSPLTQMRKLRLREARCPTCPTAGNGQVRMHS